MSTFCKIHSGQKERGAWVSLNWCPSWSGRCLWVSRIVLLWETWQEIGCSPPPPPDSLQHWGLQLSPCCHKEARGLIMSSVVSSLGHVLYFSFVFNKSLFWTLTLNSFVCWVKQLGSCTDVFTGFVQSWKFGKCFILIVFKIRNMLEFEYTAWKILFCFLHTIAHKPETLKYLKWFWWRPRESWKVLFRYLESAWKLLEFYS